MRQSIMMLVHSSNEGCRQKRRARLLKRPPIPRPLCRSAAPNDAMQPHLVGDIPAIVMAGCAGQRCCEVASADGPDGHGELEHSGAQAEFWQPRKLNGCGASEWAKRRDRDLRATQAAQPQGDPQTPRLLPKIARIETMFAQFERRSAS